MSIQTELNRLQSAKNDLKTAIQSKGVTVPSTTTLDGYPALVQQIETGDMHRSVYDPQNKAQDIFAYGPHLYKVTFKVNAWSSVSGGYTQTVSVTPVDGGPGITSASVMLPGMSFDDTIQGDAQQELEEAVSMVDHGVKTFGNGTMTCKLTGEKPTIDAEIYFQARKGV